MCQVKDRLYDLIKALFLDLVLSVEISQQELRANAKLEAALIKKKTLDLAKILEAYLPNQDVVAPESIQDLVNQLVDNTHRPPGATTKERPPQSNIERGPKKSLGGAKTAKTPPSKQDHGGKPNGGSKQAANGSTRQSPKRAKKQNTQHPERDYRTIE
jgi:hypothetical protein